MVFSRALAAGLSFSRRLRKLKFIKVRAFIKVRVDPDSA
jgi:hypothetical protein